MLSTLVYQTLSNFAKLYGLYKKVKKNETLRYVTIGISVVAILAISVVLIMLREPVVKKTALGYDPYQILDMPRTSTKKEVNKVFRKLATTKHPDVGGDPELWIKIENSRAILVDDKKRENLEKYNNPDGPSFNDLYGEDYPDWLLSPGRKFVIFYTSLAALLLLLPLASVFLVPALKEPSNYLTAPVFSTIEYAEKSFSNNDDTTASKYLTSAKSQWKSLTSTFPKFKKHTLSAVIEFRIAAREAQIALAANNLKGALDVLGDVRREYKSTLKMGIVYDRTKPQVQDLEQSFASVSKTKAQVKEVAEMLSNFTK